MAFSSLHAFCLFFSRAVASPSSRPDVRRLQQDPSANIGAHVSTNIVVPVVVLVLVAWGRVGALTAERTVASSFCMCERFGSDRSACDVYGRNSHSPQRRAQVGKWMC